MGLQLGDLCINLYLEMGAVLGDNFFHQRNDGREGRKHSES